MIVQMKDFLAAVDACIHLNFKALRQAEILSKLFEEKRHLADSGGVFCFEMGEAFDMLFGNDQGVDRSFGVDVVKG